MKYRLIALDVDGTLLNDEHELSERTIETIQEVHDQGCHIVLCTGRAPASTLPILGQLGLEGTMITHNGAATVHADERGQTLINEFAFTIAEIEPMLNYVRREEGVKEAADAVTSSNNDEGVREAILKYCL